MTKAQDRQYAEVCRQRDSYRSALAAIHARLIGEWSSPNLNALGPLLPKAEDDILRICEMANEGKWPIL